MKTLKRWQALHRDLIAAGDFVTARRLLNKVAEFRKYGRCHISLYSITDWMLAGLLDPGNNGYSFKIC